MKVKEGVEEISRTKRGLCGAGDGTRTRDNLLGRQGLCQLSYSRKITSILAPNLVSVKNHDRHFLYHCYENRLDCVKERPFSGVSQIGRWHTLS